MKNLLSPLDIVRGAAKALAVARAKLAKSVAVLTAKVDAAHRRHIPIIRQHVGAVADAEANLRTALNAAPEYFKAPRTITESGIKCGYQGHDKSLDFPKSNGVRLALLAEIKKMFTAEQVVTLRLVENVEQPAAEALLKHCTEKQIRTLEGAGAVFTEAGDHLLIKAADASIDKLVSKLLKAASDAAKDEES